MERRKFSRLLKMNSRLGGLAMGVLVLVACPEVQVTAPPLLRGTWVAQSELYDGRVMEIGRQEIVFDSGAGELATHQIRGVRTERLESQTRFALDYVMENGGEYRLHLIIDHESGQLRLAGRQQVVWKREATG
jgi:hypothetical protein